VDSEEEEEEEDSEVEDIYGDGYDEDLYKDEADRKALAKMTELDREMILMERATERDNLQERRRNAIQAQKAAPGPKKGSKAAGSRAKAPTEPSGKTLTDQEIDAMYVRTSNRARGINKDSAKDSALQALQKTRESRAQRSGTREARAKQKEEREAALSDEDEQLSEVDSDDDRGADLEDDRRRGLSAYEDEDEEEQEEAAYEDICAIQIKRDLLEKWVNHPFFADVVKDLFVRIAVGEDPQSKETMYVVARIESVEERLRSDGTPAVYPISNGGVKTSKWINCVRGTSGKQFEMRLVSNRTISPDEFEVWRKYSEKEMRKKPDMDLDLIPTKANVARCKQQLKRGHEYTYTAEDVRKIVEEKKQRGEVHVNFVAERARLTNLLTYAITMEDESQEMEVRQQLEDLKEKAAQRQQQLLVEKQRANLADLNVRNAQRNFKELQKLSVTEGGWTAVTDDDPFSRRKTRPMTYWKTKAGQAEAAAIEKAAEAAQGESAREGEIRAHLARKKAVEELVKMRLEVDTSALDAARDSGQLAKKLLGRNWDRQKVAYFSRGSTGAKTLTLNDYRRRAGL